MTNRRKNSIDLTDIINRRKNSIDSIDLTNRRKDSIDSLDLTNRRKDSMDSHSYSTDEYTPRTSSRNNSIEIIIDISNNFNDTRKINIPKRRRQRDQELDFSKSPPTVDYLKQILLIYK